MPLAAPFSGPDPAALGVVSKPPTARSRGSSAGSAVLRGAGAGSAARPPAAGESGLTRSNSTPGRSSRGNFMSRMPENSTPAGWGVNRYDPKALYYVKDAYSDFVRPHQPDYPYNLGRSSRLPRISPKDISAEVPPGWTVQRHAPNMLISVMDTYTGCARSSVKTSLAPLPDLHSPRDESIDHDAIPPGWNVPRHSKHMMEFVNINGILHRPQPLCGGTGH